MTLEGRRGRKVSTVRALVYQGREQTSRDTLADPDPAIEDPIDAILRADTTTIGGTDLRTLRGDSPEVKPGNGTRPRGRRRGGGSRPRRWLRLLGGSGDRVSVSACGRCLYCRDSRYGQRHQGAGWILGNGPTGHRPSWSVCPSPTTPPTEGPARWRARTPSWSPKSSPPHTKSEYGTDTWATGRRRDGRCRSRRACHGHYRADLLAPKGHRGGPVPSAAGNRRPPG